jgi:translation elongation factor EF-G
MASTLGLLVIGIIAVAIVYLAIKAIAALLPAALTIGVVGMLGLAFCDNTCATQSEPVETHVEKIDKYVEDVKGAAEDIGNKINEYVEKVQDAIEENGEIDEIKGKIKKKADNIQQKYHQQIRSMTRQKSSVNLEAILPELDSAISVVVWAYCVAAGDENFKPLITSANDYEGHAAQSAHYFGAAVDFRIKDMGSLADRKELVALIREELGERFTVLHEDIGKANEHLHVQLRSGTYDKTVAFNMQKNKAF